MISMGKIIKYILCVTVPCLLFCITANASSVLDTVIKLNEHNDKIVENICSELGLERSVLGLSKVQLIIPYRQGEVPFFVLGISWDGRYDGNILLLNSNGDVLYRERVGYIKSIAAIDINDDYKEEVLIDSIKGTGTGVSDENYTLFMIENSKLHKIWSELSYKCEFPGIVAKEDNYEKKGTIWFGEPKPDDNNRYKKIEYSVDTIEYRVESPSDILSVKSIKKEKEIYIFKDNIYQKVIE